MKKINVKKLSNTQVQDRLRILQFEQDEAEAKSYRVDGIEEYERLLAHQQKVQVELAWAQNEVNQRGL
jgi:hypothetical protein